jgi:TonB family protein
METVAQRPSKPQPELHLLTDWGTDDPRRQRQAAIGSILAHVAVIGTLISLPPGALMPDPREVAQVKRDVTPLIAPQEMTQPDPNKGPLSKEIHADQVLPRPRVQIPPSPPSTTRPAARRLVIPGPRPVPGAALPEPPKMEAAARPGEGPKLGIPEMPAPPPQIEPVEKPKLAFENPGAGSQGVPGAMGKLAAPKSSVDEAVRSVARGGAAGGMVVGDAGIGAGGIGEMLNMPPSPGRQASALELLSDPMGVDFRPYLIQILQNVRRNWFAVMPESAKLGRRGRVIIQFAIARDGRVPKLVIVGHSGTDALDRAAVAGISASNPFPPLPGEFRGQTVRLQFTFAYNIPR